MGVITRMRIWSHWRMGRNMRAAPRSLRGRRIRLPSATRENRKSQNFEIGRFLHLKSEIRSLKLDSGEQQCPTTSSTGLQSKISGFGFEVQESSNFEILIFQDFSEVVRRAAL